MSSQLVEHRSANARNSICAEGEPTRGLVARRRLYQSQGTGANELVYINLVMQSASELSRHMVDQADVLLREGRNVLGGCEGGVACELGGG
jgi:hypothetical protein